METLCAMAIEKKKQLNELYLEVERGNFKSACAYLAQEKHALLRVMFATDERQKSGAFRIYAAFSIPGIDMFYIITLSLRDTVAFPSITFEVPAAHWYEREIQDMFGLVPEGHPDPQRLVLHGSFPDNSHPLRKDWKITEDELKRWGEGQPQGQGHTFMKVEGEGVMEIPVGPVHAGIIEPGHFRFSAMGETVLFLEPVLFYTHKGIEKQFEALGFTKGVTLAERVSGTSSFSHAAAYCMAVERMIGIEIPEAALAARTLLLELERLYNHIGDIGNMCAGSGFAVGYAKGAVIKERLMQLNERITGSRYLRGIITLGGIHKDIFMHKRDIASTVKQATQEYKELMKLLLSTISHIERLETTGRLSKEIATKLGVTGVAARASGIGDDIRKAHPHLLYEHLAFEPNTMARGDVFARMIVRAEEAECSISMITTLLEGHHEGALAGEYGDIPAYSSALGYTESPRGSVFYWVMSDEKGMPLRVKVRSSSFCNWPALPFAVSSDIVPDFPLCNKSFNLSYSGCDM